MSEQFPGLPHITIDEDAGKADCSICQTGMTVPGPSFGPISRTTMIATFLIQHATHTKSGLASGLTAAGNPTNAAARAVRDSLRGIPPKGYEEVYR